jgi:lysophospholipase L1-like esterase
MTRSLNLLKFNFRGRQAIRSILNYTRRPIRDHNHMRVMVFGDSNAYRPGNGNNCWPALLQRESGNRLKVINESYDGRTTRYDKGERNGLAVINAKIKNAQPLKIVLVALGTNDLKAIYGPPDTAEVVEGIARIVTVIKALDIDTKPILITPPPLGRTANGDLASAWNRIPPLVAQYRHYANMKNIPIINLCSIIVANGDLEPDSVHLNLIGRKKVADIVWDNLKGVCQNV